jgi:hypothetical protein
VNLRLVRRFSADAGENLLKELFNCVMQCGKQQEGEHMSKELIEFPLENGKSVWVEVEETKPSGYGPQPVSRPGASVAEDAAKIFEESLEASKYAAAKVISKLKELDGPQEIDVEFGIKLNVGVGVLISSAGTEAHFKVSMKWKKELSHD